VPYALTLRLESSAAARVERLWQALAEAGEDSMLRLGYAPHLTLALLPDSVAAAELERAAFAGAASRRAVPLRFGALGVFPGRPAVTWLAPIVTAALLECQRSLCADLAPLPIEPHYRPEAWMPHVTLSQGGSLASAVILAKVEAAWPGPFEGWAERLELVRFPPVQVLHSEALPQPSPSSA